MNEVNALIPDAGGSFCFPRHRCNNNLLPAIPNSHRQCPAPPFDIFLDPRLIWKDMAKHRRRIRLQSAVDYDHRDPVPEAQKSSRFVIRCHPKPDYPLRAFEPDDTRK
jgi:hypothetical protein